ncbi:molybdate-binding periplasmic protein ModA [Thiomicrorhabdus immobilis]|uniref:Molybdate-binding periplasmic protein ModA n=1 Tax=Thiomicrorhabdus immobilis TaxID=2791037 RepID=A0ABN6CYY4_9GAMM|nr:molybdate ABC transporter substrate-binding protein [Thiomicrorhabdus immobilis]BCN94205.1 molybdate-binding periplasmic protein ModA [Thiomicrorhabdus immobilis]
MLVKKISLGMVLITTLFSSSIASAQETVRIAVASNFLATLKALSKDFTEETGIRVDISNGATGMLYAQIQKGAPYDLFFAADAKRPQMLEEEGLTEPGSRFTYVTGKLVVWSPDAQKVSPDLTKFNPNNPRLHFVAIANPKTAPYGEAAVATLKHYGVYDALKSQNKIALGENIGKTYHYVVSHNAQLGLVAKSYVSNPEKPVGGEYFEIPSNLYPKLVQQAVVIKGKKTPATQAFLKFFKSEKARKRIEAYGYGLGD